MFHQTTPLSKSEISCNSTKNKNIYSLNVTMSTLPYENNLFKAFMKSTFVPLKQPNSSYNNWSVHSILDYLFQAYGTIMPQDLTHNNKMFEKEWDPNTPLETLIEQIEQVQEFATNGEQPYSNAIILNNVFTFVYNGSMYFNDCKKWNQKPLVEKTRLTFEKHFLQVQQEMHQQQNTTTHSGYFANVFSKQCQ